MRWTGWPAGQMPPSVRDGSPGKRLGIAYGDGPSETLDIFPAAVQNAPVLGPVDIWVDNVPPTRCSGWRRDAKASSR
jgi:hypothetical protein